MKLSAFILLFPAVAFGVTVESLPPPQFIDTEVSATHRLEQPAFGLGLRWGLTPWKKNVDNIGGLPRSWGDPKVVGTSCEAIVFKV